MRAPDHRLMAWADAALSVLWQEFGISKAWFMRALLLTELLLEMLGDVRVHGHVQILTVLSVLFTAWMMERMFTRGSALQQAIAALGARLHPCGAIVRLAFYACDVAGTWFEAMVPARHVPLALASGFDGLLLIVFLFAIPDFRPRKPRRKLVRTSVAADGKMVVRA